MAAEGTSGVSCQPPGSGYLSEGQRDTHRRLDVDLLHLLGNGKSVFWRGLELEEDPQRSGETFEAEKVVSVRRDLDLELRRGSRQALGPGSLDLFCRLRVSPVPPTLICAHILIELQAVVEAQLVELVRG